MQDTEVMVGMIEATPHRKPVFKRGLQVMAYDFFAPQPVNRAKVSYFPGALRHAIKNPEAPCECDGGGPVASDC